MSPKLRVLVISLVLPLVAGSTFALAQEEQDSSLPEMPWGSVYELPSESVQELFTRDKNFATLDAKSPDGRYFLLPRTTELSTVENMGRPTQRLAGLERALADLRAVAPSPAPVTAAEPEPAPAEPLPAPETDPA